MEGIVLRVIISHLVRPSMILFISESNIPCIEDSMSYKNIIMADVE